MERYNIKNVEKKWQDYWSKKKTHASMPTTHVPTPAIPPGWSQPSLCPDGNVRRVRACATADKRC